MKKLTEFEPYQKLQTLIVSGTMKPWQEVGILFDSTDAAVLGMGAPWRVAATQIRRLLRNEGLEDYFVRYYETDVPGVWFVRVRYEGGTR